MSGTVLSVGAYPTQFIHSDVLDSCTFTTNQAGAASQDALFYPWGQGWTGFSTCSWFALMGNGPVANTVSATFRDYSQQQGRWLSPDPARHKATRLTDPQTWNMYAYVRNNATTLNDPTGLGSPPPGVLDFYKNLANFQRTCLSTPGCSTAYALSGPWPRGYPSGFTGGNGTVVQGNNIFDALAGTPGTVLTIDTHGSVDFAVSGELANQTQSYIDKTKSQNPVTADSVPSNGYVVVQQDTGTSVQTTGLIPDIEGLAQTRSNVANMMGYGDVYKGYLTKMGASNENVALQGLAFQNTYLGAAQILGPDFAQWAPYVNAVNLQWGAVNLEQFNFLGFSPLLHY